MTGRSTPHTQAVPEAPATEHKNASHPRMIQMIALKGAGTRIFGLNSSNIGF